MDKNAVIAKIKAMISAPSCYSGLKEKGQAWLDSVGKNDEKEKAADLIEEIKADITDIDSSVAFANSPEAENIFGKEGAKKFAEHAAQLKAAGAKYCDCGACAPALEILQNKDVIL